MDRDGACALVKGEAGRLERWVEFGFEAGCHAHQFIVSGVAGRTDGADAVRIVGRRGEGDRIIQ